MGEGELAPAPLSPLKRDEHPPDAAEEAWGRLADHAADLGAPIHPNCIPKLRRYVDLLAEWNRYFNLTAIEDPAEVVTKHILDSLTVAGVIDLSGVRTVIDVGTGAGFPGLVLKIAYPHLRVVLLDALNKRLRFLERVAQALELDGVTTLHARAEDAASPVWIGPDRHRESYDLVTARAVARLNTLSEWLVPFARVGGRIVAMKGPNVGDELVQAETAFRLLGVGNATVRELVLPGTEVGRSLVVMTKDRRTPAAYPRRPGTARKHPL